MSIRNRGIKLFPQVILLALALTFQAQTANGDVIHLVTSSAYQHSWDTDKTPSYWSLGQVAEDGHEYHVGQAPTNRDLRTPHDVIDPTFPNSSLTIHATGAMGLKHRGTATFSDLILDGGTIRCSTGNRTMTIGGNLEVLSNSTFSMGGTNTRTIRLTSTLTGNGDLNLTGGAPTSVFRLRANTSGYTGQWTVDSSMERLDADMGTMDITGGLSLDQMRIGLDGGTGVVNVLDGDVSLGTGTQSVNIGRRNSGGGLTDGTLDLSASPNVTMDLANLRLGTIVSSTGSGGSKGTLLLGTNNVIDAKTILMGDSPSDGNTGVTSLMTLGETNTIQTDTWTIGGSKSKATVDIAAGGSLDLSGLSGTEANLYIARNTPDTGSKVVGIMDLTGATSFNATLNKLSVGDKGNTNNGKAQGFLTLADDNTIDANTIIVGRSGNTGADTLADQSQLHLGAVNTITADKIIVGDRKTTGLIDFAALGGTLNLGTSTDRTEITLGLKSVSTGNKPQGTMDLRDGTANIFASNIYLGRETNTGGTGAPTGTLWLGDGALDVSGNIHENHTSGGAGYSNLNVVGDQTFNIGGFIDVNNFRIGMNLDDGSVTYAAGTTARIDAINLDIGFRNTTYPVNSSVTEGVLDLSDTAGVEIDVRNLRIGNIITGSKEGQARGDLILSQQPGATNSITADLVRVGDSPSRGNSSDMNTLQLGPNVNTMNTDQLILGGRKSQGTMTIASGGTLTLEGTAPGTPVDVDLGFNVSGSTGSHSLGELDMTGGTLDATIGTMRLGRHGGDSGSGTGIFTLEDGNVTADSIVLGTGAGNSTGTVNLNGGTLAVASVTQGIASSTANFNFNDGLLKLGEFGSDTLSMDLTQDGGTLAPDGLDGTNPIGTATIWGDYIQNAGDLEIQIQDFGGDPGIDYDLLIVDGASAGGDVTIDLMGFEPALGDYFDILEVADGISLGDWNILGDSPAGAWQITLLDGPLGGNILRLTAVPEPSSILLAILGLVALGLFRLRRR